MHQLVALAVLLLVATPRTYVLEPGLYDQITIDDGELWLGVYVSGNKTVVRACRLRVRRVPNPDGEPGAQATRVEAAGTPQPLFMLKGNPRVKAGPVTTLYAGEDMPDTLALTLQGKKYLLKTAEATEADGRRVVRLTLQLDGQQTVLGDTGARDGLYPVWAGDLDGDGRLDLYVRVEHHNFHMEQLLFLSSADPTGTALTARAARLSIRKIE